MEIALTQPFPMQAAPTYRPVFAFSWAGVKKAGKSCQGNADCPAIVQTDPHEVIVEMPEIRAKWAFAL